MSNKPNDLAKLNKNKIMRGFNNTLWKSILIKEKSGKTYYKWMQISNSGLDNICDQNTSGTSGTLGNILSELDSLSRNVSRLGCITQPPQKRPKKRKRSIKKTPKTLKTPEPQIQQQYQQDPEPQEIYQQEPEIYQQEPEPIDEDPIQVYDDQQNYQQDPIQVYDDQQNYQQEPQPQKPQEYPEDFKSSLRTSDNSYRTSNGHNRFKRLNFFNL